MVGIYILNGKSLIQIIIRESKAITSPMFAFSAMHLQNSKVL